MHLDLLGLSGGGSATGHLDPRRREVRALREDVLDGPDVVTLFLDPEVGPSFFGHGVLCQRRQHEAGYIGILDVYGALKALVKLLSKRWLFGSERVG